MTNWAMNAIHFTGTKDLIDQVKKTIKGNEIRLGILSDTIPDNDGRLLEKVSHGDTELILVFETPFNEPEDFFDWFTSNGGTLVGYTTYDVDGEDLTIHGSEEDANRYFTVGTESNTDDDDDRWYVISTRRNPRWIN